MPLVLKDRVKETSTTAGTGTLTLGGAPSGYQSFSVIGNGNTTYYAIVDSSANTWEVGIGTYTASGTTLSRDTVLESSSGGSKVSFSSNAKEVFVTYPAELAVSTDLAQTLSNKTIANAVTVGVGGTPGADTYAFYSDIAAGASKWNLFMNSGANNYLGGRLGVGSVPDSSAVVTIAPNSSLLTSAIQIAVSQYSTVSNLATSSAYGFLNVATIAAASFTLPSYYHFVADQAFITSATVTNQYGFRAESSLTGATNNYGFFGNIASGSNRWNLYMNGTANNYMAGALGIGTTSLVGVDRTLAISRNLTGATVSYGAISNGQVQSDVTALASYYRSTLSTAAAAFTLAEAVHFYAVQGSLGAGSSVTTQYGFFAGGGMTGATTNYGFYSDIPSGTGRWNFYASGTAANVFVGQTSLGGVAGGEALRATPVASSVNYIQASGSTTGNKPGFTTAGSDTNVAMYLATKGTGTIDFVTNNSVQATIQALGSAVNYLQFIGGVASGTPVISVAGSDTNINMQYATKGTGVHRFITSTGATLAVRAERTAATASFVDLLATDGATAIRTGGAYHLYFQTNGGTSQAVVTHTASAVNLLVMSGGTTGNGPVMYMDGTDTNISFNMWTKGTGSFNFATNGSTVARQFSIAHTASAVNYLQATGAATGGAPVTLSAQGSDADVGIRLLSKGISEVALVSASTGPVSMYTNGGTLQMRVGHTASAVNYLSVTGGATGNPVSVRGSGEAGVGIAFDSGGTGWLRFCTSGSQLNQFVVTHTASSANWVQTTGGATGNPVSLGATGNDTNVTARFYSKGTGSVEAWTNNQAQLQFSVTHTASAVNYIQVTGAATGAIPGFFAAGSDTNIGVGYRTKGTGAHVFYGHAGSSTQFAIESVVSSVNYITAIGSATTNNPCLTIRGSDTNITLDLRSKGTGSIRFLNNDGANVMAQVESTASSVNYLVIRPAATGGSPWLSANGADANINFRYSTKGSGVHAFQTGGGSEVTQLQISHTASAVNYWDFTGSATGNSLSVYASGSDANPGMFFITKGSGAFNVCTNGTSSNRQFLVAHTASAVNYAQITGGATGNGVTLSAAGSDTNIDVVVTPKGTGVVNINGTAASVSTATCNRTVPVKINGTTLYLMLSTTA